MYFSCNISDCEECECPKCSYLNRSNTKSDVWLDSHESIRCTLKPGDTLRITDDFLKSKKGYNCDNSSSSNDSASASASDSDSDCDCSNDDYFLPMNQNDSVVRSVINQFITRANIGYKKYGKTLDRDDLTLLEWVQHAQEEHMDAILYLEKIKLTRNKEIIQSNSQKNKQIYWDKILYGIFLVILCIDIVRLYGCIYNNLIIKKI